MIQIYIPTNTEYDQNGDMTLIPTSAIVTPEINSTWSAELIHPLDKDGRWKYIENGAVIKMPSFNGDQLFRIKDVYKTDSGITAQMEPIFMDSMDDCFLVDVRPTNATGQEALDAMTAVNSKYSGQSNITTVSTAYYQYKNLIEAINGLDDNSFINRWGGEIYFNNFEIIINEQIGEDNGVELRYGKNIPKDGFSQDIDVRNVVTRIYPKAYNGYTMSNNGYVDSPLINNYPTIKSATITFDNVKMEADATENDQENGTIICATQADLDAALTQQCNNQYSAGLDKPVVTITAQIELLQNTEQYKDYAVLESVGLGDTIHCFNDYLSITTTARVVGLTYDCILQKVTSVTIGQTAYNYFNDVSSSVNKVDTAIRSDGTVIGEKIKGFIDGAFAQLRLQNTVAKKQDVRAILFEDLDTNSSTFGALSIGTQGIQISKQRNEDNTDWIWTTAMTAAGLIANVIVAGLISDKYGDSYWDLNTGNFVIENGTIIAGTITGANLNSESSSGTIKSKININGGVFTAIYTLPSGEESQITIDGSSAQFESSEGYYLHLENPANGDPFITLGNSNDDSNYIEIGFGQFLIRRNGQIIVNY